MAHGLTVLQSVDRIPVGFLMVNADDWGRDRETTDKILECTVRGSVSAVSAMVFMEDSERSATLAGEKGIEAGLHLNFTTPFSAPGCSLELRERQERIGRYLLRHRLSQLIFHPGLASSFQHVVAAQLDEYRRIYGLAPAKIDGHHHMHLCANVLVQKLLPPGTLVRRNFSFDRGEKSLFNRLYRKRVDGSLARRHPLTDYFFSLPPLEPASRLEKIYSLGRRFIVELETHPINPEEHRYLTEGGIFQDMGDALIAPPSAIAKRARSVENKHL